MSPLCISGSSHSITCIAYHVSPLLKIKRFHKWLPKIRPRTFTFGECQPPLHPEKITELSRIANDMESAYPLSEFRSLQRAYVEDLKTIDELKKQNQYLRQTLKEYNAALSRCLAALEKNQK
ncbi:hypothetical protein Pdw03_6169 [Penicillium digitatum]|uniref:Uncharacterized protein n=1 Tax=Penicillium digitatum TaxID=36651 RepID=A0A7T6XJE2_PENDI|nr:hypothetical protein Pdw03_6169 [Penicillium digitatum]